MDNNKKLNKKIFIWSLNAILFAGVVFMGINQAGKGAEISLLEDKMQNLVDEKNKLSEDILNTGSTNAISEKSNSLGFAQPQKTVYIDSIEMVASLLPR